MHKHPEHSREAVVADWTRAATAYCDQLERDWAGTGTRFADEARATLLRVMGTVADADEVRADADPLSLNVRAYGMTIGVICFRQKQLPTSLPKEVIAYAEQVQPLMPARWSSHS